MNAEFTVTLIVLAFLVAGFCLRMAVKEAFKS